MPSSIIARKMEHIWEGTLELYNNVELEDSYKIPNISILFKSKIPKEG